MEKIFELAQALGEALAAHPAVKQFIETTDALSTDPDVQKILQQERDMNIKLGQKERDGKPIEPEEKRAFAGLQSQMAGNDKIKKFMAAQMEYSNLMRKINDLVMKPLQPPAEKKP
jgi:cell fate (sporulation/competence/biofilm development) regulator YlbF (YheA/YmcA/DUF963 family)